MSALRNLLFAALVITLLSCATDEPVTMRLDPSWSEEDVATFEYDARSWNAETIPSAQIVFTTNGEWYVEHADPMVRLRASGLTREQIFALEGRPDLADNPAAYLGGWTFGRERLIQIWPSEVPGSVHSIALHEFGHALKLRHTKTGVMSVDNPPPAALVDYALTSEDIEECRRAGSCRGARGGVTVISAR